MILSSPACLLCESTKVSPSDKLSGSQLRKLWIALKNEIGDSAYGPIKKNSEVVRYRCDSCGFSFFDSQLAGSAEFYEELMSKKIYPINSLEFEHSIRFAKIHGLKRVLDVGGGEGAFLDLACKAGLETLGVELNRDASLVAAAKGHRMFNKLMEEIDLDEMGGGADLLTLFQVVEHVPDPVGFVASAARLVRPGGYLAISVPSYKRMLGLLHLDPADWPPHHISRWRIDDLRKVGQKTGLEVVECHADPLAGRSILWALEYHNNLARALGQSPHWMPLWLATGLTIPYRAFRLRHLMPFHGLSLHAILRKPEA